jgi:hypothetical protein
VVDALLRAVAAMTPPAAMVTAPIAMTATSPTASAAAPTSGENRYIPATWTLITTPTTRRPCPPLSRCSGVITISPTMAA